MAKSSSQYLQLKESQTPVRDASSLKQSRYGPGHEKYPSWPIPEVSASQIDPARQLPASINNSNVKSRSFADETDYEKESSLKYVRPYMRRYEGLSSNQRHDINGYRADSSLVSYQDHSECVCMNPDSLQGRGSQGATSEDTPCNHRPGSYRGQISSPSSSSSDAFEKSLCADEWEAYTKKYANSEGYHSYISTESILGPNMGSSFLDLLQRKSDSQTMRWSQNALTEAQPQSSPSPINQYSRIESAITSVPTGITENVFNSGNANSNFSEISPRVMYYSEKIRRQNSLYSSYSYCNKADDESLCPNPKLVVTPKRSISSAAMHLDVDRQDSKEWNMYLVDQTSDGVTPLTVAERISALENSPSVRNENRIGRTDATARTPYEMSLDQDLPKNLGYRINRTEELHERETTSSYKPSYSFLDPQKKLRVADLTLKAIQKQALLSYYERHAGKPANIVRPSTDERIRASTCSSSSIEFVDDVNHVLKTVSERTMYGEPKIAETSESMHSNVRVARKLADTNESSYGAGSVGIATAIVAPLHIRQSKSTKDSLRFPHRENILTEKVFDTLEGSDSVECFLNPPKRPPKKPRPFGDAAITSARNPGPDVSQPIPLPRAVACQTNEREPVVDLHFPPPDRCCSPDLPLPPPPVPTGQDEYHRVSDEPLPPPPPVEETIHIGKSTVNHHRNGPNMPKVTVSSTPTAFPTIADHAILQSNGMTMLKTTESRATLPLTEGHKAESCTDLSCKTGIREVPASPNRHFDAILPPNSAYFTTSECKARLLTQYKNVNSGSLCVSNGIELLKQKEELVCRISRKLEILRGEQSDIKEEINCNEQLGRTVSSKVEREAKPNEFVKFRIHTDEIEKITSLLLGLSGRLARTENALMGLSEKKEKVILEGKRDKLKNQLQEAKILKEGIDLRSAQVSGFLQKYLTTEEYEDYLHFMKMKAKLIVDAREIDDKIKLGEEQMAALQEALAM